MSERRSNHWLKDVAQQVGLEIDVPPRPDIALVRKAWLQVVEASRMPEDRFTQKLAGHFRIGVVDVRSPSSTPYSRVHCASPRDPRHELH